MLCCTVLYCTVLYCTGTCAVASALPPLTLHLHQFSPLHLTHSSVLTSDDCVLLFHILLRHYFFPWTERFKWDCDADGGRIRYAPVSQFFFKFYVILLILTSRSMQVIEWRAWLDFILNSRTMDLYLTSVSLGAVIFYVHQNLWSFRSTGHYQVLHTYRFVFVYLHFTYYLHCPKFSVICFLQNLTW